MACKQFSIIVLVYLLFSGLVNAVAIEDFSFNKPLPAKEAFVFTANLEDQDIVLFWNIRSGYYLYEDKIKVSNELKNIELKLPPSITIEDPILGKYQVYQKQLTIKVNKQDKLYISYQGCAADGYCYPPEKYLLEIVGDNMEIKDSFQAPIVNSYTNLLLSSSLTIICISFLGFGLLLAATPCVLPMIPIVFHIIIGDKQKTATRSLILALLYVLSMATCYTLAGITASMLGTYIQAKLQTPYLILPLVIILFVTAVSQLEMLRIKLPERINPHLHIIANKFRAGNCWTAMALGAISALIISPCITPALIGALAYISQAHDPMLGGIALFNLGLGMGIPLILLAIFGNKYLPRSGEWLVVSKQFSGLLLLGLGVWLLIRLIDIKLHGIIFAAYLLFCSYWLRKSRFNYKKIATACSIILMLSAGYQLQNSYNLLANQINFAKVYSYQQLLDNLNDEQGSLVIVSADWCIYCKKIEHYLAKSPPSNIQIIIADVTNNDQTTADLLSNLEAFAPPTLLFYKGKQQFDEFRLAGETRIEVIQQQIRRFAAK